MAVPKSFTGGERLFAQDLNDNFQDLDGRVTAAQASASNASDLTFGTVPPERLPNVPLEKLPDIPAANITNDGFPFKIAYGSGFSSDTTHVTVNFPSGLFNSPPNFVATCTALGGSARIATYTNLTKNSVRVTTWSGGSTRNATGFTWIAVGM